MPRRARLLLAGHPLHIIQRGNNRSACFFAIEDRDFYLDNLRELSRKHQVAIHAYVLMTNHVHLLLTPQTSTGASLLMRHLGQRYVQKINRRYRRTGSLWEGRFRSAIVHSEAYLLTCHRYIELNPVRAGMVNHPADYPWSSFSANAMGVDSSLVTPHPLYLQLGSDPNARQAAYRELFHDGLAVDSIARIRAATNGGFVLGDSRFEKEIALHLKRRVTPAKRGRPPKQPPDERQMNLTSD